MMRRILLALGFTLICGPAFAVCPSPITGKDAAGTTQNIGTVVDGSGNCLGKNTIWDFSAGANGAGVDTSHGQLVDPASAALWNTTWAGGTLGAMANYGTSPGAVLVPGVNASVTASALPTGAATSALQSTGNTSLATIATNTGAAIPDCGATPCTNKVGSLAGQPDPCFATAKVNLPISLQTTSITQQIALSGSTKIYVCSLSLIASAATVFSVTGGTGTNCGTPAALIGTTSASHGLSLAANGGLTYGNGGSTVAVTGAGSELCLVQSGAGDLSGNLTYVQQ